MVNADSNAHGVSIAPDVLARLAGVYVRENLGFDFGGREHAPDRNFVPHPHLPGFFLVFGPRALTSPVLAVMLHGMRACVPAGLPPGEAA